MSVPYSQTIAQTIAEEASGLATMKDVATLAGVSVTTVSHVLNDSRVVRPEVRERVLTAMDELEYKRNALARSLRQKHSHTIGLILPDATNPFFAEIARSISDESALRGYSMIICNTDGDPKKEDDYFHVLAEKRVDGIVLIEASSPRGDASSLGKFGIPAVMMDRYSVLRGVDTIRIDNSGGGRCATEHLLSLGHARIACIAGPSEITPSAERVSGYRSALSESGIPFREEYVLRGDFHPESGHETATRLLRLPDRPTAIFACNDLMAFGAIRAACEMGLSVPNDISVVGFDDIRLAAFFNPPLTTVAQPHRDMGRIAVALLAERICEPELPVRSPLLPTELVRRSSTAAISSGRDRKKRRWHHAGG